MITLNDIRRFFEEQNWPYDDQDNFIVVKTSTMGEEQAQALAIITCDELFNIECTIPNPINVPFNDNIAHVLNSLNYRYNFFQFYVEEVENKCRLNLKYCIPTEYLSDPKIAAEMLIRSLRIMDDFYAQIMQAKWAK